VKLGSCITTAVIVELLLHKQSKSQAPFHAISSLKVGAHLKCGADTVLVAQQQLLQLKPL
jgi:hypothetical protein